MNANSERLSRSYNELLEMQVVLEHGGQFFEQAKQAAQAGEVVAQVWGQNREKQGDSYLQFDCLCICSTCVVIKGIGI